MEWFSGSFLPCLFNQESYREVWVKMEGASAIRGRGTETGAGKRIAALEITKTREEEETKETIEVITTGTTMS
ncbi:hypothetical protein L1887_33813 [Cichorium endivia]|nr:hypothetical protein L1887_33813 [Cichorium endivia]